MVKKKGDKMSRERCTSDRRLCESSPLCGYHIKRTDVTCTRKLGHPGRHITCNAPMAHNIGSEAQKVTKLSKPVETLMCTAKRHTCVLKPADWCQAMSITGRYLCTRQKGHEGPHIACDPSFEERWCLTNHNLLTWTDFTCTAGNRLCVGLVEDWCKHAMPYSNHVCSRAKGHTGNHIACTPGNNAHNWGVCRNADEPGAKPQSEPTGKFLIVEGVDSSSPVDINAGEVLGPFNSIVEAMAWYQKDCEDLIKSDEIDDDMIGELEGWGSVAAIVEIKAIVKAVPRFKNTLAAVTIKVVTAPVTVVSRSTK